MKNLGLLTPFIKAVKSVTPAEDLVIPEDTGYTRLPVTVKDDLKFESGDYGTVKVNGKERTAILWKKVRKPRADGQPSTWLPEVKVGEVITWLHIAPEKPKINIEFGEEIAS